MQLALSKIKNKYILYFFYILCFVVFYDMAELATDDGQWSGYALDLVRGYKIPWQVSASQNGTFHTTLFAYLTAIPLLIYQSHFSILVYLFLSWLVTHHFLFRLDTFQLPKKFLDSLALLSIFLLLPCLFSIHKKVGK
jgi:hypothetical protein